MDEKYSALFTPWKIGNVEIKNRIVMCPMGGTSLFGWMEPNHFDNEAAALFRQIAQNNVGLIIPGIAPLRDTILGKWLYQGKGKFKKLKQFMDEIHKTGAKLFVQLTAGFGRAFAITDALLPFLKYKPLGALMKPIIDIQHICASPSELPSRWAEDVMCRALTKKEIEQLIYAFAQTAKLCKEAGVDGVEVHAVHEGYLLDQFTLPYTNKRTDEYGGSFENRYRFPVQVVQAIKKECGKDYPVSLRYSVISKTKGFCEGAVPGEEYVEVGRDMEESERAAKYLQDAGYDMLNADNGTYDAWYWAHPPAYMPVNCNLDDVAHIKKFVDIPVVCAGRMRPADAAEAIKEGRIDAMGVARQFLTDQQWVTKLVEGRESEIKPCICCHNACFDMAHYKGVANDEKFEDASHMARCALNPQTMQSGKYDITPANVKRKIAVIGGGIGGILLAGGNEGGDPLLQGGTVADRHAGLADEGAALIDLLGHAQQFLAAVCGGEPGHRLGGAGILGGERHASVALPGADHFHGDTRLRTDATIIHGEKIAFKIAFPRAPQVAQHLNIFGEIVVTTGEIVIARPDTHLLILGLLPASHEVDAKTPARDGVDGCGHTGDDCRR